LDTTAGSLTVNGGGEDEFKVEATSVVPLTVRGISGLVVQATEDNDHIVFKPGATVGEVGVIVNGVAQGAFYPIARLVAYGLAGNDDFQVAGSLSLPAWLYGGIGDDRMKGGAGHDVLLGGAGEDLLIGGDGRDLMIDGTDADRMVGNADDDVLVAGSTAYDADQVALAALMAEWTRTDLSYADRVAHLQGASGGHNQGCVLTTAGAATVYDDGAADVLTGGAGADWFLTDGQVKDKVTDWSTYEQSYAEDVEFMNAAVG
jgi:Ca2+-binding RTX toxin-like protein